MAIKMALPATRVIRRRALPARVAPRLIHVIALGELPQLSVVSQVAKNSLLLFLGNVVGASLSSSQSHGEVISRAMPFAFDTMAAGVATLLVALHEAASQQTLEVRQTSKKSSPFSHQGGGRLLPWNHYRVCYITYQSLSVNSSCCFYGRRVALAFHPDEPTATPRALRATPLSEAADSVEPGRDRQARERSN